MSRHALYSVDYRSHHPNDARIDRGHANFDHPDEQYQSILSRVHGHETDHDDENDEVSIAADDDFLQEYRVDFTESKYARLGLSIPKKRSHPLIVIIVLLPVL